MALQPLVCNIQFESGYWWNNSQVEGVATGSVDPSNVKAFPCPRSESCLLSGTNRSICVHGHTGILCARCTVNYGMSTGGICSECFDPGKPQQQPRGKHSTLEQDIAHRVIVYYRAFGACSQWFRGR